ncbi:hypothetical protein EBZ02_09730 [bacterium]|nr:hypothetical protein [bacterium]NDA27037.1 hypothetical protein [Verrucomicrobiota bacterium]
MSERNKTGRIRVMAKEELRIQAWMEQLRRMREMQYAYHKKFFHGLYFFLLLTIACLLWDSPLSLALVPFLVITAGTQSCFYLHFVDFARLHARHLETQLNKALGKGTLVGSEIEDLYFYPIDAPKIGGFVPSTPLRFFSFFTLHWILLWLGLAAFALWRLVPPMGPCGRSYLAFVALWGGLNFAYLAWFFGRRRSHRLMESSLRKQASSS